MIKKRFAAVGVLGSLFTLTACVSIPTGPSMMSLPGTGRNYADFRLDDEVCRRLAVEQNGGVSTEQRANESAVGTAAAGTAIGAAAGAAFGGHNGAAAGAGMGLLMGSMMGAGNAQQSAHLTQRQYDHAYFQCMYGKGHRVPASPGMTLDNPLRVSGPPSLGEHPPPPAGTPPAPPPTAGSRLTPPATNTSRPPLPPPGQPPAPPPGVR